MGRKREDDRKVIFVTTTNTNTNTNTTTLISTLKPKRTSAEKKLIRIGLV